MNSTTTWIHNGIISNVTSSQWVIESATNHDSGKYICQKQGFYKSKPVYLDVMRGMFQGYGTIYLSCEECPTRTAVLHLPNTAIL